MAISSNKASNSDSFSVACLVAKKTATKQSTTKLRVLAALCFHEELSSNEEKFDFGYSHLFDSELC